MILWPSFMALWRVFYGTRCYYSQETLNGASTSGLTGSDFLKPIRVTQALYSLCFLNVPSKRVSRSYLFLLTQNAFINTSIPEFPFNNIHCRYQ